MQRQPKLGRRDFIVRTIGATAGAWLVLEWPVASAVENPESGISLPPTALRTSAWLTLMPDDSIQVDVHKAEMGQGVLTALPMLIAEELGLPMSKVTARIAPAGEQFLDERGNQTTGYSSSVRTSFLPFRMLGATARELLIAAAAYEWRVDAKRLRVRDGRVVDLSNPQRQARFGELLETARSLPVPKSPRLKDPVEFRLLGTRPTRLDTPSKIDGSAVFGMDFKLPGMLVVVLARPPTFDGILSDVDDAAALAIPGVIAVKSMQAGVAVFAENFWAAEKGRRALRIDWDPGANESQGSAQHERELVQSLTSIGSPARTSGDFERLRAAKSSDHRWLGSSYFAPFLAHAALEPIATTVLFHEGICEVWVGTQAPSRAHAVATKWSGLPPSKVKINCLPIGGSFGRRGEWDYVVEAVVVARSMPGTPIKLVWSREDDIRHDFYRPASAHQLLGCLNARGDLIGLEHRMAAPSIARRRTPEMLVNGYDRLMVQGSDDMLYDIGNLQVDYREVDLGVPVGFWRSVGHSHNGFVVEGFVDELAALAKRDPLEFRLSMLRKDPRMQRVLRAVAAVSRWGRKMPSGLGLGIAAVKSYDTRVAMVAEVEVRDETVWRVRHVWCAVDCGSVVHPGLVEQQMQGGIVFGLTAARHGEITFERGVVQQGNFNDYPLLSMSGTPQIDVQIVASDEPPTGVGEPATPVIAPAVANALFAATGQRLRRLPLVLKATPKPAASPTLRKDGFGR